MEALLTFLRLGFGLWLGTLLLIVAYQLLTGRIKLDGLLTDPQSGHLSPARLQLLIASLAGAFYYVYLAATQPGALPDIPPELLLVLGGSQTLYLGDKARLRLRIDQSPAGEGS